MLNLVACGPQEDNIFYWNLCPSLVFLGWQRTYPLRTITSSTQTTAQEYIGYCSIVAFFSFKYFHLAFRHAPPINLVSQPKKQKKDDGLMDSSSACLKHIIRHTLTKGSFFVLFFAISHPSPKIIDVFITSRQIVTLIPAGTCWDLLTLASNSPR